MSEFLEWKVATYSLFKEIISNSQTAALKIPLNILLVLLKQVGQRAIELDDPQMNALMLRLGLYSISNPDDPEFNPELVEKYLSCVQTENQTKGEKKP